MKKTVRASGGGGGGAKEERFEAKELEKEVVNEKDEVV